MISIRSTRKTSEVNRMGSASEVNRMSSTSEVNRMGSTSQINKASIISQINRTNTTRFRGAITVEAAIVLPVIILLIVFFSFLIKLYYTYEVMQQAISEASKSMGVYSLLYYNTNAEELIGGIEEFCSSDQVSKLIGNPELEGLVAQFGSDINDYVRAQVVLVPFAKVLIKQNILGKQYNDVDRRLSSLGIVNGFKGIDFSKSRMLADGQSIDIVAQYNIHFPFLSQILPPFEIEQNASSCAWGGAEGIDTEGSHDDNENSNSVWDKDKIERGQEIRKLEGANLPSKFPTIAKLQNGTAISIKSMNIDEKYYQNGSNIKTKLKQYIDKLAQFNGGKSEGTTVGTSDFSRKELVLVIPETNITTSQRLAIEECKTIAAQKGITLTIKKAYGKEGVSNEQND